MDYLAGVNYFTMPINDGHTSLTTKRFPVFFFVLYLSITGVFTPYSGAKSNNLRWLWPVACRRITDGANLLCLDVSSSNIFGYKL